MVQEFKNRKGGSVSKVDLHISMDSSYFQKMEKMRAKKTRSAFIESLMDQKDDIDKIASGITSIKNNQKRIFALLFMLAKKFNVPEEEIEIIVSENKEGKYE